jgi:hypothetical protein
MEQGIEPRAQVLYHLSYTPGFFVFILFLR